MLTMLIFSGAALNFLVQALIARHAQGTKHPMAGVFVFNAALAAAVMVFCGWTLFVR